MPRKKKERKPQFKIKGLAIYAPLIISEDRMFDHGSFRQLSTGRAATSGAIYTLRWLVAGKKGFGERVFLYAPIVAQEQITEWLEARDFFKLTGILPKNVLFCDLKDLDEQFRNRLVTDIICECHTVSKLLHFAKIFVIGPGHGPKCPRKKDRVRYGKDWGDVQKVYLE